MKYSIIALAFLSLLHASETQRVHSIVQEITKLRDNSLVQTQINDANPKQKNSSHEKANIQKLTKEIDALNKLLKTKENEINSLKKECEEKTKPKENSFPKLVMKEAQKEETNASKEGESLYFIKPRNLSLSKDASIYSAINGKLVAQWNKNRQFTSNQRSKNWIKITGYFVAKSWQGAKEELWVEALYVESEELAN